MPELWVVAGNSPFSCFQFGNGGIYYGLLLCCESWMEIFQACF